MAAANKAGNSARMDVGTEQAAAVRAQLLGGGGGLGHGEQGGLAGAVLRAVRRLQAAACGGHLLQWRAPPDLQHSSKDILECRYCNPLPSSICNVCVVVEVVRPAVNRLSAEDIHCKGELVLTLDSRSLKK